MRSSLLRVFIVILGLLIPAAAIAQSEQTTAANPPIAQPLVREGDFAVDLAAALKLGTAMSEAEAESALSAAGITPRNGWIADYPVTPDIIGEVQAAINEAANSGKLAMGKDAAMTSFQEVIKGYNMSVRAAGQSIGETPPTSSPQSEVINNYYYTEGTPVVTYYAPPPDYAYLYTWVPYPFFWWNYWYPGFFVLVDFDIRVHSHGHEHIISNHFHNPRTGRISRIDPTNRFHGGTFPESGIVRRAGPSEQRGARRILNRAEAFRQFRGYGVSRPAPATRSSAFDRSANRRFEQASSDRGFQSRSRAGQIPPRGSTPTKVIPRGGTEGFHGGGRSR